MSDFEQLGGWIRPTPDQVESVLASLPHPVFADAAPDLVRRAKIYKGTDVYLYKSWTDVLGKMPEYPAQEIGDCTSFGTGHAVDLRACIEIAIDKESEEYKETCTEAIYGIGREIANMLGGGDGCYGGAVAKAVTEVGTISREAVGAYTGRRAKEWGGSGVPSDVKQKCGDHKVKTASLVSTWDELVAAISNGYPVEVCSDQGFTMTRSAKGICEAQGSWAHCMLIAGLMYVGTADECAIICQSWGPGVPSGPTPNDMPDFSFGARRKVVERMLAGRDSYALSKFDGYPGRPLPSDWTFSGWSGF